MDQLWSTWGAALGGMMAVNVLYMMLSSWVRAMYELVKSHPTKKPWSTMALISLVHAGPWALIVAISFAVYVHTSPWALWFFGGAAAWTLLVIVLVSITMRKLRRQAEANRNAA